MNTLLLAVFVVVGVASLAVADSTDELMVSDGTGSVTFYGGYTPGAEIAAVGGGYYTTSGGTLGVTFDVAGNSQIVVGGTLDGWNFEDASGTSNSPGVVPFGIDIGSLLVSCSGATCSTLTVAYSDTGFTAVVPGFQTSYSLTSGTGGPYSTTQYAYEGTGIFDTSSLIGTVGPLTASGTGGISPDPVTNNPGAYSLTLVDTFSPVSSGSSGSYSVDGNITAVPEPSTFGLLGAGLLGFVALATRKRKFAKI